MIFMVENPAVIQSLLGMEIAGYAVVIIVPWTAEGHGIVKNFFTPSGGG
jgi:hypothetical protein